jgi:RNase P subunit RPR2
MTLRTPEEVAEEFVKLMQMLENKDTMYEATAYKNPVLMAVRSRDAEWRTRIKELLLTERFCPDCGWIGEVTDHYCERCKQSVSVSQAWEEESVNQLLRKLEGSDVKQR